MPPTPVITQEQARLMAIRYASMVVAVSQGNPGQARKWHLMVATSQVDTGVILPASTVLLRGLRKGLDVEAPVKPEAPSDA